MAYYSLYSNDAVIRLNLQFEEFVMTAVNVSGTKNFIDCMGRL